MDLPGQGDSQLAVLKAFAARGHLTIPRVFLDVLSSPDLVDYAGIGQLILLLAYGETQNGNIMTVRVPRSHPDAVMLRRIVQDFETKLLVDAVEEPDGTLLADLSPLMEMALNWLDKQKEAAADPSRTFRGQVLQGSHPLVLSIESRRGGQKLTPRELELLIEWHELLGLDLPVIQHLVDYCAIRGKLQHFAYLNKVAMNWSERGIRSMEDLLNAREEVDPRRLLAREVLRELGISRQVTPSDEELAVRWLEEWGFEEQAVIQACRQAVRRERPFVTEVDKTLAAWHKQGLRTAEQVAAYLRQSESESEQKAAADEFYYQVLRATGITKRLLPANRAIIDKWRQQWRLEPSVILFACQQAANAAIHRLDYVDAILSRYKDEEVRSVAAAAALEEKWRQAKATGRGGSSRRTGTRRSYRDELPPNMQLPVQGDEEYYGRFVKKIVPGKGSASAGSDPAASE